MREANGRIAVIVVVMGVTGTGKSSVGKGLASALGLPFVEGDDFHGSENIEKMRRNEPLSGDDRRPWIDRLHRELCRHETRGAVLACSALTTAVRDQLTDGLADARFVFLQGDESLLRHRLEQRTGHFAGPQLLASQLDTLEEPDGAVWVDVDAPPDVVLTRALAGLRV